jgi:hypothetical protein
MNRPCPRCGQNLIVHARGPARITCPVCLASVATGSNPMPLPPLPLSIPATPVAAVHAPRLMPLPLQYHSLHDDVEAELERDFRWSLYGIVTFAATSLVAAFVIIPQMDITIPAAVSLAGAAVVTTPVGAWLMARHRRARAEAGATGVTTRQTTGERVLGLVTLGIGGVVAAVAMLVITAIVLVIVLFVACFGGGFKL